MTLDSQLKIYKYVSLLEGISFLVLLFIAMPLKYIWEMPLMVKYVGMAHGILFIAYVYGAFWFMGKMNWKLPQMFIILICAILPFGPFYVEKKYLS